MGDGQEPAKQVPEALTVENRRRIFDLVQRAPGIHLREIVRELELPYGTAEYHLRVLEQEEIVRAVVEDNYRRFYPADFSFTDRAVLGLLRKRPVRRIVVALLERGQMTHQELAQAAGLKASTLSYQLGRLEAAKLVTLLHEGRFTRVALCDAKLVARLLVAHSASFGDDAVERFLATWSGFEAGAGAPAHEGQGPPPA